MLMQQREMGLPIEPILARSPQLKGWMDAISTTAPELFEPAADTWRGSEHVRTLAFGNYLFTAIYDLVILTPDRAEIIDWKTYPLPKYKKDLSAEWQTRLYLYLLAETSDYLPKQINFTYWFIQSATKPKSQTKSVRICYNLKQHDRTHQDLLTLIDKLSNCLDAGHPQGEQFPQVNASTGLCQHCNFAHRCGREGEERSSLPILINGDLSQIPAISIPI